MWRLGLYADKTCECISSVRVVDRRGDGCVCVHVQMREALHANAVEQKKRQLRSVEAQLAAKRNENATLALHLAGTVQEACCLSVHHVTVPAGCACERVKQC